MVGTPGTLLDWCLKFRAVNMKKINVFVLDEADVMISLQGHQDQSVRLQRYVNFFTAGTITAEEIWEQFQQSMRTIGFFIFISPHPLGRATRDHCDTIPRHQDKPGHEKSAFR